jgi:hypothetical protein
VFGEQQFDDAARPHKSSNKKKKPAKLLFG